MLMMIKRTKRATVDIVVISALFVLATSLFGCNALPQFVRQSAPTPTLAPFVAPTAPLATPTAFASPTTQPAATSTAISQPASPIPLTSTPTHVAPSATLLPGGIFARVKIFLIAINDNGKSGKKIGCGDSVVAVDRVISPTNAPLRAAFNELLSLHDQFYGQSGLYNALYQSHLTLGAATIVNRRATLQFSGTYQLGGECDNPRFEAQIKETALQFSTVSQVSAFINGKSLESIISLR